MLRTSNLLNIKNESILIMLGFTGVGGCVHLVRLFAGRCFSSVPEFVPKPRGFYVLSLVVRRDMDKGWGETGRFPSGRHVFVPELQLLPRSGICWQRRLSHHGFTRIRAHISPWMELPHRMWDGRGSVGGAAVPRVLLEWGQGSGVNVFHSPCEGPRWQQRSHLDVSQEPL